MRLIILGGTGMLGHTLWERLPSSFPDTYTTIRKGRNDYGRDSLYKSSQVVEHIDVLDLRLLACVLRTIRPDVILNCVGITKRREAEQNPIPSIAINALFPHHLAQMSAELGAKLIHFSTDCVFDGAAGNYSDDYPANATDLYGRTKALGEVSCSNTLTLRSSFIGYELGEGKELLVWFLSQRQAVRGFKNAIYAGLTTIELSRIIEKILRQYPHATGLYNVSSAPISKYELLKLIGERVRPDIEIIPEESFYCDRSLDSSRFRENFNYVPPAWASMVEELCQEYEAKK